LNFQVSKSCVSVVPVERFSFETDDKNLDYKVGKNTNCKNQYTVWNVDGEILKQCGTGDVKHFR